MRRVDEKDADALEITARCLLAGGVAVVPTETVYGIVTLYDNYDGAQRIYAMKHRPADKRLQMLAPSLECAVAAGVVDSVALRRLERHFWPGALTAIVPSTDGADTIGLRIPDYPFMLKLLQRCGKVLAATSANRSGEPPAVSIEEALAGLAQKPDVAVDGGVISVTAGQASTVVSLLGEEPQLLRQGVISLEDIRQALKEED